MKKTKWLIIIGVVAVIIIVIIIGVVFFVQQLSGRKVLILPDQLFPSVSLQQARKTICNQVHEKLFKEACQKKFDSIAKNNEKDLAALFSLIKKIQDDHNLSDYNKYLLGQLIFSSLPTKGSPLSSAPKFFTNEKNTAYAQEIGMSKEQFREMMAGDLEKIIYDLPKGDNAWVINVMVSRYSWINGERQPIYSEQYSESFDPFPDNVNVDKRDIIYHTRAFISSQATNQSVYQGSMKDQDGEMIAYSYTIASWYSLPKWDELNPPKHFVSYHHFSEENYQGENLMPDLLAKTAPEKQSADRLAPRNTALDFVKGKERVEKTTWSRLGVSGESLILKGGLNLDKIGQTSWGDGESWDTAYERYFWLHLQNPKLYPDFWQAYNSESAEGEILRSLPVGEPVDLNSYFYSAGVAEFYERWRKNNAHIPKIYDVIENIDEYQKNLAMPKPNIKNTQVKQTNGGNSKNAGTTTDYNNNTIVACLNGIKKNEFDIASDKCVINGETVLTLKELNSRQEVLNDMELFFGSAIYEFFEDNDSLTAAKNNFLNYNKGKKEKNEKDIKIYNTFENPGIGDESVLITTNFEQNLGYGHKIGLDVWANYSAEVSLNVLVGSCWFWLSGTSVRQKNWGENHQIVYIGKDENKQAKYKIVNKDHNHGQGTIKPILLSYGQDLASRIADVCGGKRTR